MPIRTTREGTKLYTCDMVYVFDSGITALLRDVMTAEDTPLNILVERYGSNVGKDRVITFIHELVLEDLISFSG